MPITITISEYLLPAGIAFLDTRHSPKTSKTCWHLFSATLFKPKKQPTTQWQEQLTKWEIQVVTMFQSSINLYWVVWLNLLKVDINYDSSGVLMPLQGYILATLKFLESENNWLIHVYLMLEIMAGNPFMALYDCQESAWYHRVNLHWKWCVYVLSIATCNVKHLYHTSPTQLSLQNLELHAYLRNGKCSELSSIQIVSKKFLYHPLVFWFYYYLFLWFWFSIFDSIGMVVHILFYCYYDIASENQEYLLTRGTPSVICRN